MANSVGRPRKPATVHHLNGNPGKRPLSLPDFNPKVELPSPPEHLLPAARAEWIRIGPLLEQCGLVSAVDRAALALYCQAYGRWQEAEAELAKIKERQGSIIVTSPNGYPMHHPLLNVINKAQDQVHSYLQQFGLSPAVREKVTPSNQRGLFDDEAGEQQTGGYGYAR